ncbi:hypothetical protein WJX84_003982 [Apatococcus fuscideae]|uniref:Uncharacterized protein n=1 Tax=Apatococcus fuscideae TaxID=2026836 RepID=A0AAW1SWW0_9CHLO
MEIQDEDLGKQGAGLPRDSRRTAAVQRAIQRLLNRSTKALDLEDFCQKFPQLPERLQIALHDLYQQALHQTQQFSEEEIADIFRETHAWSRLHELDQQPCEKHSSDAGHSAKGPATVAVRRAQLHVKQREKQQLEVMLQQMKEEQAELQEKLAARRDAHNMAAQQLQASLEVLQKVQDCTQEWYKQELGNARPEAGSLQLGQQPHVTL